MKLIHYFTLLSLMLLSTSCDFHYTLTGIVGNGNVTLDKRVFNEKFEKIKVSSGLDLEVVYSTEQIVNVEADENLLDVIETEYKNGTLYISANKNIRRAKSKKVYVGFVDLNAIHASSGSSVKGSSDIVSDNLDLKVSSGAQMNVFVLAKELTARASSGANLTVKGQTLNFSTKASSGSAIDAKELQAVYCTSRASSGANITLNIEKSLDAKASSGGDIRYQGNPEVVNQNTSSSGRVRKR